MAARLARVPWAAFAPGVALSTAVLLPAWGAALSLRPADLSVSTWLQLLGLTALGGVMTAVAARPSGVPRWGRGLLWLPLLAAVVVFAQDTGVYLQQSLRFAIVEVPWADRNRHHLRTVIGVALVASLPIAYLLRHRWRAVLGLAITMLCALAALLALQYAFSAFSVFGSAAAVQQAAPRSAAAQPPVVVLVFDELDSEMLAERSPQLPGFQLLGARARAQGRVYPPANYTHISVPSMLTGRPLVGAEVRGDAVMLAAPDGSRAPLGRWPNLLSEAASGGGSVSVVGWHLPYCAVWKALPRCIDDAPFGAPSAEVGVIPWMLASSRWLWRLRSDSQTGAITNIDDFAARFFADPRNLKSPRFPQLYARLADRVLTDARSGRYDLVYAHLPCPHLPRLDGGSSQGMVADYQANLKVCDRLLASLLAPSPLPGLRMVVTSDHWFRGLDWKLNGAAAQLPKAARQVPLYVVDEAAVTDRVVLDGGSNIGLLPIARHLMRAPKVDSVVLRREAAAFGAKQTFLDRF